MARLIDNRIAVEMDQVVAGLPVVEFVDEAPDADEMQFIATVPRRWNGGARLDRSLELCEWFEF